MNGKNENLAKSYEEKDEPSSQKGKHERDHKKNNSKREHDKHHPKGCCAMGPIIGLVIMITHFCFMKRLHTA
jgi:ABC-type Zn2+ transport system substrate-binding protein/surface adhesin